MSMLILKQPVLHYLVEKNKSAVGLVKKCVLKQCLVVTMSSTD